MSKFSDDYILFMNQRLNSEDLEMLDKISKKYNVLDMRERVLQCDIEELLSRIIINELPFGVGTRFYMPSGALVTRLVLLDENRKLIPNGEHYGQRYIMQEINRINKLLNES